MSFATWRGGFQEANAASNATAVPTSRMQKKAVFTDVKSAGQWREGLVFGELHCFCERSFVL